MSNGFDRFMKTTGELLEAGRVMAGDFLRTGKEVASEAYELMKEKTQELKLEAQLRRAYAMLGEEVYEHYNEGELTEECEKLVETITSIKQTLSELEERINARKQYEANNSEEELNESESSEAEESETDETETLQD